MNYKVYVYGSLKQGYGNHRLLEKSELLGNFITPPDFTMYHLGGFPGVMLGGTTSIHGEVYDVNEEVFTRLDQLEGYPHFYNRKEVDTEYGKAWMYYLNDEHYKSNVTVDGGVW